MNRVEKEKAAYKRPEAEVLRNYEDATSSQTQHFNTLFKYALDHGVYLPPSAYETCFISTAHNGQDIEQAAEILTAGIRSL